MTDYHIPNETDELRAFLVGIAFQNEQALLSIEDSLSELALLARTAGIHVVGRTWQRLRQVNPKTLIGSGKLEEIVEEVNYHQANVSHL